MHVVGSGKDILVYMISLTVCFKLSDFDVELWPLCNMMGTCVMVPWFIIYRKGCMVYHNSFNGVKLCLGNFFVLFWTEFMAHLELSQMSNGI